MDDMIAQNVKSAVKGMATKVFSTTVKPAFDDVLKLSFHPA